MITKEELAKLSRDEVMALYYKKRNACKTCAQLVEMFSNDQEFIMIKERYSEFSIEERRKNEQRKKAQVLREFAERVKNAFYAEFDEIIPSVMANKIDELGCLFIARTTEKLYLIGRKLIKYTSM